MISNFLQHYQICTGFVPVDMQTAANNGDWVSLANYQKCIAVLFKAAGTAGDDPVFTLKQATSASGTNSKNLTFTTIYKKVGTLTSLGTWTITTQSAAATYTDTDSAESQCIMCVEIDRSDLDTTNGFYFVQLSIPDIGGNAQLGCAFYILGPAQYPQQNPQTAIA